MFEKENCSLMNNIMVSVLVTTYNHEKYIIEALESIRMQVVNFPIEVLVGEDCSTDKTRQVIKEYEIEHPGFLRVFYREHNMYREKISNSRDLEMHAKGKYIITLEGDDFWTDKNKLQTQVDFLETHSEYIAVAHNCIVVDEYSHPNGEVYPECKENEYSINHFYSDILPGQTATYLRRNTAFDRSLYDKCGPNKECNIVIPGDRLLVFSDLFYGKIFCIQKAMSAYRHLTKGDSWSAQNKIFPLRASIVMYKWYSEYAFHHKQYYQLTRYHYLAGLKCGIKSGNATYSELIHEIFFSKKKLQMLIYTLSKYLSR